MEHGFINSRSYSIATYGQPRLSISWGHINSSSTKLRCVISTSGCVISTLFIKKLPLLSLANTRTRISCASIFRQKGQRAANGMCWKGNPPLSGNRFFKWYPGAGSWQVQFFRWATAVFGPIELFLLLEPESPRVPFNIWLNSNHNDVNRCKYLIFFAGLLFSGIPAQEKRLQRFSSDRLEEMAG